MAESKTDAESHVRRNPHPDFKSVESYRPPFDHNRQFSFSKTPAPDWELGSGSNDGTTAGLRAARDDSEGKQTPDGEAPSVAPHVSIDPYEPGRPAVSNYKLLISAIVPRPIGFISTTSAAGDRNLAPFSYTNVVNHDPPVFTVGFAGGFDKAKDTLRNLTETRECTINIISEHYLEAANACSINAPLGVSEWALSGLTPVECISVKAPRVGEAIFSVEGRLMDTKQFESRADPGKKTGVLAIIEGVRFWAREDAFEDNEEADGKGGKKLGPRSKLDPKVLRPVSRLGGITYGRMVDGIELPRPDYAEVVKSVGGESEAERKGLLRGKV
ncbi:MAG: hypothetical protein M1831_001088 [Alyxoria varia]|nr:MAG: hypothetical protein M1831_001088 [Alyxoria varia]